MNKYVCIIFEAATLNKIATFPLSWQKIPQSAGPQEPRAALSQPSMVHILRECWPPRLRWRTRPLTEATWPPLPPPVSGGVTHLSQSHLLCLSALGPRMARAAISYRFSFIVTVRLPSTSRHLLVSFLVLFRWHQIYLKLVISLQNFSLFKYPLPYVLTLLSHLFSTLHFAYLVSLRFLPLRRILRHFYKTIDNALLTKTARK